MDMITFFIDFILKLDQHLSLLIQTYGIWSYVILFAIIFLETGLVVTPFLPGDSLLFAAGAFAALGSFNIALLFIVLSAAAIVGDAVNYWIGKHAGIKLFRGNRLFKEEYLEKTQHFYERHGRKTIFIARFIPIIRTFAPFVAGIGKMQYRRFAVYNVLGGVTWVAAFLSLGFFFGNIPFVRDNFALVLAGIIIISFMPAIAGVIRLIRNRIKQRSKAFKR